MIFARAQGNFWAGGDFCAVWTPQFCGAVRCGHHFLQKEPHSEAQAVGRAASREEASLPRSEAGEVAGRDIRNGFRDAAPGGFWSIHLARMPS